MPEHNTDTQGQAEGFLIDLPDRLAPGHRPGLPFEQVDDQEDDRHGDQDDKVPGCMGECHGQTSSGSSAISASAVGIARFPACTSARTW